MRRCEGDTISRVMADVRIARAKRTMCKLSTTWKVRSIPVALKRRHWNERCCLKLLCFGHICRGHGCQITITVVEGKDKTREAAETVHGQSQVVDNNVNITVRRAYGLPKTAVDGRHSSVK